MSQHDKCSYCGSPCIPKSVVSRGRAYCCIIHSKLGDHKQDILRGVDAIPNAFPAFKAAGAKFAQTF